MCSGREQGRKPKGLQERKRRERRALSRSRGAACSRQGPEEERQEDPAASAAPTPLPGPEVSTDQRRGNAGYLRVGVFSGWKLGKLRFLRTKASRDPNVQGPRVPRPGREASACNGRKLGAAGRGLGGVSSPAAPRGLSCSARLRAAPWRWPLCGGRRSLHPYGWLPGHPAQPGLLLAVSAHWLQGQRAGASHHLHWAEAVQQTQALWPLRDMPVATVVLAQDGCVTSGKFLNLPVPEFPPLPAKGGRGSVGPAHHPFCA